MARLREKRLKDGSKAWMVVWVDPAGREQSKQFSQATTSAPKAAAEDYLDEIRAQLRRGTYVDPAAGDITFGEYVDEWLAVRLVRPQTATNLRHRITAHLRPALGQMRMGAIRRRDIQQLITSLRTKQVGGHRRTGPDRALLAPSYIVEIYRTAASIFADAVTDEVIGRTPCTKIRLPEVEPTPMIIPTQAQVAEIAGRVPDWMSAMIWLGATTGLRSGELRGLDRTRLDVLRREVRVDRQLITEDSGAWRFGPPKSRRGHRTVPIIPSVVQEVSRHIADHGLGPHDLVFTNSRRRVMHRTVVNQTLSPILRSMGFPPRSGLHLLRHHYASGLIAQGLDVVAVAELLGDTEAVVHSTYLHLWEGHRERTRAAVEAAFAGPSQVRPGSESASGPARGGAKVAAMAHRRTARSQRSNSA